MIANSCEATGKIDQPQKISVAPVTLTFCGFFESASVASLGVAASQCRPRDLDCCSLSSYAGY
jgi:hypothetical protein